MEQMKWKRHSKKRSVAFTLGVVLMLTTACAGEPRKEEGAGTTDNRSTETVGQTKEGESLGSVRDRTLLIGVPATSDGLDMDYHNSGVVTMVVRNMNDYQFLYPYEKDESGFLVPDFNADLVPRMAESCTFSEDGLTMTVRLKKGIKSHDGNELTAADIVYKFQSAFENQTSTWTFTAKNQGIEDVAQIKVIDDYTYSITTKSPNPMALSNLAHVQTFIYDSKASGEPLKKDPQWMNTHEAGYGPYKLKEFTPGQQVVLEKFTDYWDQDAVSWFDDVIVKEIPESANRAAMLMSGDLDIALDLTDAELHELAGKEDVKVLDYTGNRMTFVGFDHSIAPLDDPKVRQALSYAAPYQDILDTVYLGEASPLYSPVPSIYPGYTKEFWEYGTDLEKARALLAEAGYGDGFKLDMVIEASQSQHEQIAIFLQSSLREIGVELTIQKVQSGDFWSRVSSGTMGGLFAITDSPGSPDPALGFSLYAISDGIMNMGRYKNEEVDALYAEMMATLDQDVRMRCAERIQEITVKEDPLWMYISAPGYKAAMRSDIQAPQWNAVNELGWNYMYRQE